MKHFFLSTARMKPSHRIFLNTAATYGVSVLGAGLAIFSSRWVFIALGQSDYGLFSVVGSIIVFITFLNAVLSGSAARHYAFSLGQNDIVEVNRWFNAALSMHLVLGAVLVLAGWQIGEYVIANILTIPIDRLSVCLRVFRISLISAFVSMVSIPFIAMFTAKQHIAVRSIWAFMNSLMNFALAFFLIYAPGDRLLFYAGGMVGIIVFIQATQTLWALIFYAECRIKFYQWFDAQRSKEILSFAGWNLIGSVARILRAQGSAVLLNIQFGAKANAAYGIANTVSNHASQLATAMINAFAPEITTSEGRGDRTRMLSLAQRASKFGTILALFFCIPLMIEMEYVLKLWLVEPPLHAATFCRMLLITFIVDRLSVGCMLAVNARGKVAAYQATVGICFIMTLPLAWLFLKLNYPPPSVTFAFIITITAVTAGRLLWVRKMFGVPINHWLKLVLLPCGIVVSVTSIAALTPYLQMPQSLSRLACVIVVSIVSCLFTSWLFACDKREREFCVQILRRILKKSFRGSK